MAFTTITRRSAAVTTLGLTAVLGLTACGSGPSNALDGEYYSNKGQLVIDGGNLEFHEYICDKQKRAAVIDDLPAATGKVNEDGTQVVWDGTQEQFLEGRSISGTSPIAVDTEKKSVSLDRFAYVTADKDAAVQAYDHMC